MTYWFVSYHVQNKNSWGLGACYYRIDGKYFNKSEFEIMMSAKDTENKVVVTNYFQVSRNEYEVNKDL